MKKNAHVPAVCLLVNTEYMIRTDQASLIASTEQLLLFSMTFVSFQTIILIRW